MVSYTGKDINDLGRYDDCQNLTFTHYILFTIRNSLPINIFIGLCAPINCSSHDFTVTLKPEIRKLIDLALNAAEDDTSDSEIAPLVVKDEDILFVDPTIANKDVTGIYEGTIVMFVVFAFLLLSVIAGTTIELLRASHTRFVEQNKRRNTSIQDDEGSQPLRNPHDRTSDAKDGLLKQMN